MSTGGAYAGRTDVITLHGQCAAPLEACEASPGTNVLSWVTHL